MAEAPVLLEISGGVGRLTLNRPGNANAIDVATARALAESAGKLAGDPTVRAVLLRGAGDRFCGGGDVKSFADARDGLDARLREIVTQLHVAMDALASLDAPVVAAVQGSAAGAGFALALAADLVLAAESARFVLAYTGIGLTPDGGTTWYLERTVGRRRALELVLTNRALSAAEALDWGLVTRVVPDEDLGATAEELVGGSRPARPARSVPPNDWWTPPRRAELDAQLAAEAAALTRAGASSDGVEGVRAFTEKRRPSFRGD